nr:hypothetical protein [Variovorax sp. WS11]
MEPISNVISTRWFKRFAGVIRTPFLSVIPMATFLQAIKLTGNWRNVRSKAFIAACGWEGSPFIELYERLRLDPEWATHRLDCAHDVPRLAPEALTRILLEYV